MIFILGGEERLFLSLVYLFLVFSRFSDQGIPSSTALNANGRPEAGMGVAVEDVDGNGLMDLYVTNFEDESNTLMLQIAPLVGQRWQGCVTARR